MAGGDGSVLLVAEHDGPSMFARIAMMRALHRHRPEPTPARWVSKVQS
jgi:hypothetical protein